MNAETEWAIQCDLLRDIVGPLPFRPITLNRSCLTPPVLALAQTIYDHRQFERMRELAQALKDDNYLVRRSVACALGNLGNGAVELVAEGEEAPVTAFLNAVAEHMQAYITGTVIRDAECGRYSGFEVRA